MLTAEDLNVAVTERAGYFPVPGAHLYTVLHQVNQPVARVLLVGAFASERHNSYHPWLRWARYLAARQIEVQRYDYRGVGESTGSFEKQTFANWLEDVMLLTGEVRERNPHLPIVLHGLEAGAILAAKAFQSGQGDALLLWSPPANAQLAMRSTLIRWAGLEQIFDSTTNRRTAGDYIRMLEAGTSIEVAGYEWPPAMWNDALHCELPSIFQDDQHASGHFGKPVRTVKLGIEAAPLVKRYVGYDEVRDLSWLYQENYTWLHEFLGRVQEKNT